MKIALQVIALCCTLGGIILTAHKRRSCWVVYQIGGVALITVYLMTHLYILIIAQAVYMTANVYGWLRWGRGRHTHLKVRREWLE
jgi:nicotinamide riboside transporter PnuC